MYTAVDRRSLKSRNIPELNLNTIKELLQKQTHYKRMISNFPCYSYSSKTYLCSECVELCSHLLDVTERSKFCIIPCRRSRHVANYGGFTQRFTLRNICVRNNKILMHHGNIYEPLHERIHSLSQRFCHPNRGVHREYLNPDVLLGFWEVLLVFFVCLQGFNCWKSLLTKLKNIKKFHDVTQPDIYILWWQKGLLFNRIDLEL